MRAASLRFRTLLWTLLLGACLCLWVGCDENATGLLPSNKIRAPFTEGSGGLIYPDSFVGAEGGLPDLGNTNLGSSFTDPSASPQDGGTGDADVSGARGAPANGQ